LLFSLFKFLEASVKKSFCFFSLTHGGRIKGTIVANYVSKFGTDSIASAQFSCLGERPTYPFHRNMGFSFQDDVPEAGASNKGWVYRYNQTYSNSDDFCLISSNLENGLYIFF
jgi:hypothetical protein